MIRLKRLLHGQMLLVKNLLKHFYKKELPKTNQREIRVEKVVKRKGDKLNVKWRGYNDFFDCWIAKKDIINE